MKNRKGSTTKTEYKGVLLMEGTGKFRSDVTGNGKRHWCGIYDTAKEAAIARDKAILKLGLDLSKLQVLKPKTQEV